MVRGPMAKMKPLQIFHSQGERECECKGEGEAERNRERMKKGRIWFHSNKPTDNINYP